MEFLQIWSKHSVGLKDELIQFWCWKIKVTVTSQNTFLFPVNPISLEHRDFLSNLVTGLKDEQIRILWWNVKVAVTSHNLVLPRGHVISRMPWKILFVFDINVHLDSQSGQMSKDKKPNMFLASWTWNLKSALKKSLPTCHLDSKINWFNFRGQRSRSHWPHMRLLVIILIVRGRCGCKC